MAALVAALVGVACGAPSSGGEAATRSADRDRYAAALSAGSPESCLEVHDPDLRGDCLVAHATALAVAGEAEAAAALCEPLPLGGVWRGECYFSIVDADAVEGVEAAAFCRRARPFTEKCMEHAGRRSAESVARSRPLGAEAQALTEAAQAAQPFLAPHRAREAARRAVARALQERWTDRVTAEGCGSAPEDLQALAYEMHIQDSLDAGQDRARDPLGRIEPLCPPPVVAQAAAAAGFLPWEDTLDGPVQEAWGRMCAHLRDRRSAPPQR